MTGDNKVNPEFEKSTTVRDRRPTHDKHGRPIPRKTKPKMVEKSTNRRFSDIAKTGPLKNRRCTDCVFCIIFYIFVLFHIGCFLYGFIEGNPWLLAQPYDVDSNACGATNTATADYPYAYFIKPMESFEKVICVKSCPNWLPTETAPTSLGGCYIGGKTAAFETGIDNSASNRQECSNVAPIDLNQASTFIIAYLKAFVNSEQIINMYNSTAYMVRFCIPTSNDANAQFRENYSNFLEGTQASDKFEEYVSDLANCWVIIISSAAFAFFVSLFYMLFLRCCVGVLIWITILIYFVGVITTAVLFHRKANFYDDAYT